MKASLVILLVTFGVAASINTASPVSKVTQMLTDLEGKIHNEGVEAKRVFEEFSEWCEERARNVGYEIKTGKKQLEDLTASIEKSSSDITAFGTKIEELSGSIAASEADLNSATNIRKSEAADFAVQSKELRDVVGTLERAISILERELAKGSASMMQVKNTDSVVQALSVMLQASAISSDDASRLTALLQSKDSEDSEEYQVALGAPAAKVYGSHSGSIVDTLQGLLDKANAQLESASKKEMNAVNNFGMLKQSLDDEIRFANKDMTEAKKNLAGANGDKASATGDLAVTSADLKADQADKQNLGHNCMSKSQDFEGETKSRAEEVNAIQAALKALQSTGGAGSVTYGLNQVSFLQLSQDTNLKLNSGADLANFEAVRFVRDLARKHQSGALYQLASRMASAMRLSSGSSDDPFAKVKGLIKNMIETLMEDSRADASHKAYCDKQTGETLAKKEEATATIEKLSTKIDMATTRSAKLKEQVADLQKELAELASSQAEMNKVRTEERSVYRSNKKDMDDGLEGVKMALNILRDYYAKEAGHTAASGAGSGIIGMLEVVESDFSKNEAEMTAAEGAAASQYDGQTKENEITRAAKGQDVKYKTREATGLDKSVSELSSDKEGTQAALSAVTEYLSKLDKMCVAKPETYSDRKGARESEIAGLKEALKILAGEAVLLQQTSHLRGVKSHA